MVSGPLENNLGRLVDESAAAVYMRLSKRGLLEMKKYLLAAVLIMSGCVSTQAFSDPRPNMSAGEFKALVRQSLKNPYSVKDFAMSREPYQIGPDGFGRTHWIMCANYFATNSYGGLVRSGVTVFFKDGTVEKIQPTQGQGCANAQPTKFD